MWSMPFTKGHTINLGNQFARGHKHTEEWKQAQSERLKGNTNGFKVGKPSPRKGTKATKPAWNKGMTFPERRGLNHPNWKTDRTTVVGRHARKSHDPEVKQWRRDVWERDGFVCRYKDADCQGRIEAHHILRWADFPELRYDVSNGITLCHYHHPRTRIAETAMLSIYRNLIDRAVSHSNSERSHRT